jgi:putative transposase
LRSLVDWEQEQLSVRQQCALLGLARSSLYYAAVPASAEELALMRRIDEQYLHTPFYGSRRMAVWLQRQGYVINRKRVQRLMRWMGLEALYPKPRTSASGSGRQRYPYLLRNLEIIRPNQVWSADITYVPLRRGFLYLVAVLDWYSRYVLSWRLSNSLDEEFCVSALEEALESGRPEIFNTDQGAQFTGQEFVGRLEGAGIAVSWDGRGRALDNVFVERLWRTVKYEEIYLKAYADGAEGREGLRRYFPFYNRERPHQSLGYQTPWEVHGSGRSQEPAAGEKRLAGRLRRRRLGVKPVALGRVR